MLFNSPEFLLFLPIVFGLYWFVVQRNLKAQNMLLVIMRLKPLALLLVLTTLATTADAQRQAPASRRTAAGKRRRTVAGKHPFRCRRQRGGARQPSSAQAGRTPRRAITRSKTRPHANACGKTTGGENEQRKAVQFRGGGAFSGSQIATDSNRFNRRIRPRRRCRSRT